MVKYEARESPVRFLEHLPIRRGSGGPQKRFSSLSEGAEGVFTIHTDAGEETCILHILGAPMSSLVAGTGGYSLGPFSRNVCRNAWETVVL
jgi:hypothetical protein